MSGSTNLSHLLGSMKPELHEEVYVFATVTDDRLPANLAPVMQFKEVEGTTLIVSLAEAEGAGIKREFPCRMITLNIHSSLDAAGFLAFITERLATLNIGVNPVSGFYHDHLFVPVNSAAEVLAELKLLSAQHAELSNTV